MRVRVSMWHAVKQVKFCLDKCKIISVISSSDSNEVSIFVLNEECASHAWNLDNERFGLG